MRKQIRLANRLEPDLGELEKQPEVSKVYCVGIRGMLQPEPVIKNGIFRKLIWILYTELIEVLGLELREIGGKLLQ